MFLKGVNHMRKTVAIALLSLLVVTSVAAAGVLIVSPTKEAGLNDAAYHRYRAGDRAGAERLYLAAIAEEPSYQRARYNLATLYFEQGRNGEAIAQLEELVTLDPSAPAYHYDLAINAIARFRAGGEESDFWLGLAHFEEAEQLSPGFAYAVENLAVLRSFLA